MSRIHLYLATGILGMLCLGIVVGHTTAQNGNGDKENKVTICHVGDSSDPSSYETLTLNQNQLKDHFNEAGSPQPGHENDLMGECPQNPGDDSGQGNNNDAAEACGEFVEGDQELPQVNESDCPDSKKVTICHVAGNTDDPANYVTITISENGLNGHFNQNGTPRQGHENDFMGPCPSNEASNEAQTPAPPASPAAFVPITVGAPVCQDVLVYHTNQTEDWEIFRLGDSGDLLNLSQGEGSIDVSPSMSPDKQWIVFTSNRDGNWELYVVAMDGSSVQRLTRNNFIDADPMWSPDGKSIVFQSTREGERDLYLFDVTTGQETRLTQETGNDTNPFWSSDGSKLVFQSNRDGLWQIYELTLSNLATVQLTTGEINAVNPQYSFDGTQISYRGIDATGLGVVYVMNADGSDPRAISDPAGNAENQVWSPDDSAIAYQSGLDGDRDIYVYDLASGQTRLLTDNTAADYAPTWFCGSQQLAFTSEVTGNADIFSAQALPVSLAPLKIEEEATHLIAEPSADLYPLSSPSEEDASHPNEFIVMATQP